MEEILCPKGKKLYEWISDQKITAPKGEIMLAYVRTPDQTINKLVELRYYARTDLMVRLITTSDPIGMETYRRSVTFLYLKALYDVVGRDRIRHARIECSTDDGYYCPIEGDFVLDEDLVAKIEARMRELAEADLPIARHLMKMDDALGIFEDMGMQDKIDLFRFRRVSAVNVYELEGYYDYFYGYMATSTRALTKFSLHLYEEGIVLQMPTIRHPDEVKDFEPTPKVFEAMIQAASWAKKQRVSNIADLNQHIVDGTIYDLMLVQEALQEQQISHMAHMIAERPHVKFVMIAGPSSSGKTSFSHRLSIYLRSLGLTPHPIAVDDYFLNREDTPKDDKGNYLYEDLVSIDTAYFGEVMNRLLSGQRVEMPRYDFVSGHRRFEGEFIQLGPKDLLVIEGIHCLNPRLYPTLPQENMFKIYISALTQLNVDEHNRVATTDGRLIRRMIRDAARRGIPAAETIRRWGSVRDGEVRNIFPFQEEADAVFNSAQAYELSLLKTYAEPLLFTVKRDQPEYQEAKRLLKFLDYLLALPAERIPGNSIMREFVGGSVFRV